MHIDGVSGVTLDRDAIQVEAEYPIRGGRLDLLIKAPSRFLVVLENKVFSSEGEEQLKRYRAWLLTQDEPSKILLYLTPGGDDSNAISERPDRWLSYRSDISGWLQSCLKKVTRNPRLYGFLAAYLDSVRNLGRRVVPAFDEKLVTLLLEPNNIDTAYEVWETFDQSIRRLQLRFWKYANGKVRERLRAMRVDNWITELDPDDALLTGSYPKLTLRPNPADDSKLYCRFVLERDSNFKPYYGIHFSKEVARSSANEKLLQDIPDFRKLEEEIIDDDFKRYRPWWLGWRPTGIDLRDKASVLQLAQDQNLQLRAADHVMSIFEKYRDLVESTNSALRSKG